MSIQQHEPLRIPDSWGSQERQMIFQLERILDDLYRRFNRLKISDLEKGLREELETTIKDTSENKENIEVLTDYKESSNEQLKEIERKLSSAGIDYGINMDNADYPIHGAHVNISKDTIEVSGELNSSGKTQIDGSGYTRVGLSSISQGGYISGKKMITEDSYLQSKGINVPVIISPTEPEAKGVLWIKPNVEITQYVATVPSDMRFTGKTIDVGFPTLIRSGEAISGGDCLYLIELAIRNKTGESNNTNLSLYITDAQLNRITLYTGQEGKKCPNDFYYINTVATYPNLTDSSYLFLHLILDKEEKTSVTIPAGTKIILTCIASGTNNCEVKLLS